VLTGDAVADNPICHDDPVAKAIVCEMEIGPAIYCRYDERKRCYLRDKHANK
jgi:hypothetical protein